MKKIFYVVIGTIITISPISARAQFWQSSGTNIYNTNTGKVGINNLYPSAKLDISLNGTPATTTFPTQTALHVTGTNSDNVVFQMDVFGGHGIFDIRRANGTSISPTALLKDDEIGALAFRGYGDASGYATGASGKAALTTYASENWNATNQGTYMLLSVTPNGTKNLTTALKLGGDLSGGVTKNFGIGTFLPNIFGYNPDIQRVLTVYGGPNIGSRAVLELVSDPLNNVPGNTIGQIDFNAQSQTSTKRVAIIQGLLTGSTPGNYGSDIAFLTKNDAGAVSEKLRITGSGNVGIGTSSPNAKLDVSGNIKISGSLISDGDICIGKCQ